MNKVKVSCLINDLSNLKFITNTFADKQHENSVRDIFIKNGLSPIDKNNDKYKYLIDISNSLKEVDVLKDDCIFIEQPFGSQMCPDFIVCVDGFIMWIECKSGSGIITWNTGSPKTNILFVFSCKKMNTTTLFFGQHHKIIQNNPEFEKKYELFDKELKKIATEKFNNLFGDNNNSSFYMRRMFNDSTKYSNILIRADFFQKVKLLLDI